MYKLNTVNKILASFSKSIPLPPEILLIIPLYISVVALPRTFGPTIVNTVLAIANIATINNFILYFPKYPFISFLLFL